MLIKESPCNTCKMGKKRCGATANCAKWREWFCEMWPIVTGRKKQEVELVPCPSCGAYIDAVLFTDGFAICPYCEKEVEWRV